MRARSSFLHSPVLHNVKALVKVIIIVEPALLYISGNTAAETSTTLSDNTRKTRSVVRCAGFYSVISGTTGRQGVNALRRGRDVFVWKFPLKWFRGLERFRHLSPARVEANKRLLDAISENTRLSGVYLRLVQTYSAEGMLWWRKLPSVRNPLIIQSRFDHLVTFV